MSKPPRWQPQRPGGGNNIPESYLRKMGLRGGPEPVPGVPERLARFIEEELS